MPEITLNGVGPAGVVKSPVVNPEQPPTGEGHIPEDCPEVRFEEVWIILADRLGTLNGAIWSLAERGQRG